MFSAQRNKWLTKIMVAVFGLVFLAGTVTQVITLFYIPPEQRLAQAEELIQRGQSKADTAALDQALQTLTDLKEDTPEDYRIYMLEGQVYRVQKSPRQALDSFKKAGELTQQDPAPFEMQALLYDSFKQPAEVEKALKKALEIQPANALASNNLGVMYLQQKKYKEAEQPLLTASKLQPDFADVYRNLGFVYQHLNQPTKAVQAFQTYLQMMPTAPEKAAIEKWLKDNALAVQTVK